MVRDGDNFGNAEKGYGWLKIKHNDLCLTVGFLLRNWLQKRQGICF